MIFKTKTKNLTIHQIPVFTDNYIYVGQFKNSKEVFVVDPGESERTLNFLLENKFSVKWFLVTHEHDDHVAGLQNLRENFPAAKVICHSDLNLELCLQSFEKEFEKENHFQLADLPVDIIVLPGHTKNHLAFSFPEEHILFCGDILFGLGCGRIISGTYEQQYESMHFFSNQQDQTLVFCAHEYTERNLQFIIKSLSHFPTDLNRYFSVEPGLLQELSLEIKSKIEKDGRTVPLSLGFEKKYNPFLISKSFSDFQIVRQLRNKF